MPGRLLLNRRQGKEGGKGGRGGRIGAPRILPSARDASIPYLADQIVLYLALARGTSSFTTTDVTAHLLTNLAVIERIHPQQVSRRGAGRVARKGHDRGHRVRRARGLRLKEDVLR